MRGPPAVWLAHGPAVGFCGLDFHLSEPQLSLTMFRWWEEWRENWKAVMQRIAGKSIFYDFDFGRDTIHHLRSDAGKKKRKGKKKQNGMELVR